MTAKKKTGRPLFEVNWTQVESMCAIHCTGEEIAGVLGCDYDTLVSAIKREYGLNFSEYFQQKSASGKVSLRRKQYTAAMEGDRTMQIWLGKQWLGQAEKQDVAVGDNLANAFLSLADSLPD
jgi:hypothetical protein